MDKGNTEAATTDGPQVETISSVQAGYGEQYIGWGLHFSYSEDLQEELNRSAMLRRKTTISSGNNTNLAYSGLPP